jgi:hypothetical protein
MRVLCGFLRSLGRILNDIAKRIFPTFKVCALLLVVTVLFQLPLLDTTHRKDIFLSRYGIMNLVSESTKAEVTPALLYSEQNSVFPETITYIANSLYDNSLGSLLMIIYFQAPALHGYGFWGNIPIAEACFMETKVPVTTWYSNPQACNDLIFRKYDSFTVMIHAASVIMVSSIVLYTSWNDYSQNAALERLTKQYLMIASSHKAVL